MTGGDSLKDVVTSDDSYNEIITVMTANEK